jgi:hypothetical protein
MKKKETAIDWLLFELSSINYLPNGIPSEIYNKARQMEQEQIIEVSMYHKSDSVKINCIKSHIQKYYE